MLSTSIQRPPWMAGQFVSLWVAAAIVGAAHAPLAGAADQATLLERANQEIGLFQSALVTVDVDRTPGISQTVFVPIGGETLELRLNPHSVRADGFRVRHQLADGSLVEVDPGPVRTVRGTVQNAAGTVVGAVTDAGLTAAIRLADGPEIWVEPLFGRVPEATPRHHVVYTAEDVMADGRTCAAGAYGEARLLLDETPMLETGFGCEGLPCLAEVAIDADHEYFNIWGAVTETRIETVMGFVNQQYESQVGIVYLITEIIVRMEEPDPYDQFECGALLDQFQEHWQANHNDIHRDEAHLFTGKNIQGCAGIAYGGGQICGPLAYALVPNFGSATDAASVSAHELGHNWSAQHCGPMAGCDPNSFPPGGCSCQCHTMRCSTVFCRDFHPICTIPFISQHRDTRSCLDSLAPATTFPFMDTFDGPGLDPARWYNGGATVDDQGDGEPSGTTSLRITGGSRATSGHMDATSVEYVGVEYWWQRTGNSGGSPEPGEDLLLEFVNTDRTWQELNRHPGDGDDNLPYARACAIIPDADPAAVQIRFSMDGGQQNSDNFFVDDVRIGDGAEFLAFAVLPDVQCACSVNGSAQFTAEAAGEAPFSYQWLHNGQIIPGATNPTLDLANIGPGDFGNYSVRVGNACGEITSSEVPLLSVDPIAITQQPMDNEVPPGGTLSLFTFASGGCAEFQWYKNGQPIPDANGSFLFIPNMQCENQGCYHAVVSNNCNSVESEVAVVSVTGCPPVECQPVAPPEIVHATGLAGETRPYSGYVDPRNESSDGVALDRGITEIAIRFSEDVQSLSGGPLTPADFIVTETGGGTPPNIVSVNSEAMPLVVLTLDRPITLQEYTTIQAVVQDFDDPPNVIVNNGDLGPDANEPDRVDVGFLPADVDQSESVTPFDLLVFRQIVNDVTNPSLGTDGDYVDTNRDGAVTPFDLLAFRQLINGIPPATQAWATQAMNHPRP